MIQIDIPMPTDCRDCPCAYFTEGAYSDYCQINQRDFEDKDAERTIFGEKNGHYKRPIWCPLIDLEGEDNA